MSELFMETIWFASNNLLSVWNLGMCWAAGLTSQAIPVHWISKLSWLDTLQCCHNSSLGKLMYLAWLHWERSLVRFTCSPLDFSPCTFFICWLSSASFAIINYSNAYDHMLSPVSPLSKTTEPGLSELLTQEANVMFNLIRNGLPVLQSSWSLCIPTSNKREFQLLYILINI